MSPIQPSIFADFSMTPSVGAAPLFVTFTNQSKGFAKCEWNFGDGITSKIINPTHTFNVDGTYNITLTIYYDDLNPNISDTIEKILVVTSDVEDEQFPQHGLFTHKRFSPGQVSVSGKKISGTIFSSDYPFSGVGLWNLNNNNDFGIYNVAIVASNLTNQIAISMLNVLDNSEFSAFCSTIHNHEVEGFLMLGLSSQTMTSEHWNSHFANLDNIQPIQILKITGTNMPSDTMYIELDRDSIFKRAGSDVNRIQSIIIIKPRTGSTVGYDSYNSKFTYTNFALDSYQNLQTTGITHIDNSYIGALSYFGMDEEDGQTLTVSYVPYSGYEAADKLTPGTFLYNIPWIMWHKKKLTEGITLRDVYGEVELDETTNLRFKYLRDGITADDNIVGKIFYDKKVIVITDRELNAALMFQSNRNWTLPEPRILDGGTGGDSSTDVKYYISYAVRDETNSNFTATTSHGYNYSVAPTDPMHCAYVKSIIPSEDGRKFKIEAQDSPWKAIDVSRFTGFSQNHIAIIIGTGTTDSTYAENHSWKISACTTTASLSDGFVIPDYSDFTTEYKWGSVATFDREEFPIGSQTVGFGYMSGHLESTIYKMSASCVARNNEFNETQNKTFDRNVNSDIFITEVALYNEQNEMLMIGKLNKPIIKNNEKYITIKVELDL